MYHDSNSDVRIKIRKDLLIWGFILAAMVAIATGDVGQNPAANANDYHPDEELRTGGGGLPAAEEVSADETIQSLLFDRDAKITDALRFLGAKYHKNIVPSPGVQGVIMITRLYDVTFEEAMEAIVGYGFEYEQDGNFIRVYTAEEYKTIREDTDRMVHKVFTLYYITAAEARKLVSLVLSSSGKIEATSPAEIGVPTGATIGSATGGGDTTAMNDTIIVYDYPENVSRAEEVIASIDVRPKQVLIEATILSATLTEDMQLGIDWQTLKGTAVTSLTGITQSAPDYFKSMGTSQVEDKTGGMTIGLAFGDIGTFIRAVEEITDITLLANPKILTVNKQLGQVYIGDKYGYREGDTFDAQGNRVEGKVKFLDTGTKLSFRPYIGNDGYIRMDIHSKDSSGSVPASGIPQETSAELVTNIMVKDGETIVIGGLFRDKVTTTRTQIPLLGDLPILGAIFRGTADKVERQEVIILLTPHIIEEPSQANGQARADDIRRKRFGAKDGLQWTSRARLAEDRYASAVEYYLAGDGKAALHQVNTALELRPTYLEAIRLKERIIGETSPDDAAKIERNMLDVVERQESSRWLRR